MHGKALFEVHSGSLRPSRKDARGETLMAKLHDGELVLIAVHRARWPEHNALAHTVFARIGEAIGQPLEVIKLWLKWETGWVDLIKLPTAQVIPVPRSLSFESMTQDQFQAWWDEAWVVLSEKALPKVPPDVFEEIQAIVNKRER
jgi:hypothetical protein